MPTADQKAATTKKVVATEEKKPRISKLERLELEIAEVKANDAKKRAAKASQLKTQLEGAEAAVVKATERVTKLKQELAAVGGEGPVVTDGIGDAGEATFTELKAEEV